MDNAFSRPFPGYTLPQLKAAIEAGNGTEMMAKEVARREAVAAGDISQMTSSERLRAARKH